MNTSLATTAYCNTIYVSAGSGAPPSATGPFGWCARIVTADAVYELAGASGDVHFSLLYTAGTIAALNALPDFSTVEVVCSDHNAVGRFKIAEDVALRRNRRRWKGRKPEVLQLGRELHQALLRHTEVTTRIVPMAEAEEEQVEAHIRVAHVIDEFLAHADFNAPMPDRSKLKLVSPAIICLHEDEPNGVTYEQLKAEPEAYRAPIILAKGRDAAAGRKRDLDLPW